MCFAEVRVLGDCVPTFIDVRDYVHKLRRIVEFHHVQSNF